MSGKIVTGYDPLLKVTIFQRHLTHTYTQIESGEGGKKSWGLLRIVYCACEIYVLWSPAINTHSLGIRVHINRLIPFPLQISFPFARKTGANGDFYLFCSFPIISIPCYELFSIACVSNCCCRCVTVLPLRAAPHPALCVRCTRHLHPRPWALARPQRWSVYPWSCLDPRP